MEWPLWSLHVDEAGEGGGGISGLIILSDDFNESDLLSLLIKHTIQTSTNVTNSTMHIIIV